MIIWVLNHSWHPANKLGRDGKCLFVFVYRLRYGDPSFCVLVELQTYLSMHLLIKLVTFSTLKRAWRNHQLEIPSFDVLWKNRWCLEEIYWYFHAKNGSFVNSNNNVLSKSPIFDCSHAHVGRNMKKPTITNLFSFPSKKYQTRPLLCTLIGVPGYIYSKTCIQQNV